MATARAPQPTYKPKPPICFRVYATGSAHPIAEGDQAVARAAALAASQESPSHRYEVREVPAEMVTAQGAPVANEGGRYERSIAACQGGREVPVA